MSFIRIAVLLSILSPGLGSGLMLLRVSGCDADGPASGAAKLYGGAEPVDGSDVPTPFKGNDPNGGE